MSMEAEIRRALETAFAPADLVVMNESHRHAGHAGDDGTGESHWAVSLTAPTLAGLNRVEKHRAVHAALGADIMGRIHALALTVR